MLTKISINDSIDHFPGAFISIKSDNAIIVEQMSCSYQYEANYITGYIY